MNRRFSLISGCIGLALSGGIGLGQTGPSDSQTLQSLLVEVRQLRQALQNTTVAGQKIQVTLFRLQIQMLTVARATQRLDDLRSKLITAEFDRKREAGWVENLENLQKNTEDQKLRADREVEIHQRKGGLEMLANQEQQLRSMESEALAQVQAEQSKLSELQDRLDQLDKTFETSSQQKP